eukprot:CAMPEP_0183325280 /NCGR_PEP_ID=MMETSP0160_2-20130417/79155_1 /TAXON_ID=2839 ORGANISM="Odontella Sinensis, Strain Grunow 1884" /NCGR_SAMPLE_ID=MMETSP0160_2 /ASSEMBLY_ACC=CAM_ASM_000250 /LENGTH=85 /DNA_ID=CAMNT_0025493033 /DNA_START=39 /DNA_END=292 /DNA_ORIENTATION=+
MVVVDAETAYSANNKLGGSSEITKTDIPTGEETKIVSFDNDNLQAIFTGNIERSGNSSKNESKDSNTDTDSMTKTTEDTSSGFSV